MLVVADCRERGEFPVRLVSTPTGFDVCGDTGKGYTISANP